VEKTSRKRGGILQNLRRKIIAQNGEISFTPQNPKGPNKKRRLGERGGGGETLGYSKKWTKAQSLRVGGR